MTRGRLVLLLVPVIAIVVGVTLVIASVRRDSGPCTERTDPLDPGSLQHVLPGSPPPSYLTDPPTSGPHQSGRLTGGVLDEPAPGPVQVGALEAGQVLIQHRPGVAIASLAALTTDDVVVLPNPALPAPIVATAWRHTLRCSSIDVDRIRKFAEDHARHDAAHP